MDSDEPTDDDSVDDVSLLVSVEEDSEDELELELELDDSEKIKIEVKSLFLFYSKKCLENNSNVNFHYLLMRMLQYYWS